MSKDILKIAVCDDMSSDRLNLVNLIKKYMLSNNIIYSIQEYESGEKLLADESLKFDIIFLDIYMDILSGIETAERIKSNNKYTQIILCSTSNEFVTESYSVSALYYIIKPIKEMDLFAALDRYIQVYHKALSINIKVGRDSESILVTDIIYAEAQGKKTIIHTKNKTIEGSILLSQFEELLPQTGFCKPIRYAIVSMNEIVKIPSDYLQLSDGTKIQISRNLRKTIKETFTNYKLEKIRQGFIN